jgi:uncharacterized membrane protein YdjX (TVP38/TMEM64 family)
MEGSRAIMRRRLTPTLLALLPAMLLVATLGGLLLHPGFRGELSTVWGLLLDGDPEPLRGWLLGFGMWAPLVSGLLQVATSVFPPGPSFVVAIANAMLFGMIRGGILTFVTALLAAAICFGIARVVGRPGVERLISERSLARMDGFMARRGFLTVFIGRLIPFINPDVVSYAAGVTGIRWVPFLIAIAAGSLPATAFYSIVGATAIEASGWVMLVVFLVSSVPLFGLFLFRRRILAWSYRRERRLRDLAKRKLGTEGQDLEGHEG